MTDPIRDAAIEAAAECEYARRRFVDFDWSTADSYARDYYRGEVTPLVDAVLAAVGPSYRAEALRDAADDLGEDEGLEAAVFALHEQADIEEDA